MDVVLVLWGPVGLIVSQQSQKDALQNGKSPGGPVVMAGGPVASSAGGPDVVDAVVVTTATAPSSFTHQTDLLQVIGTGLVVLPLELPLVYVQKQAGGVSCSVHTAGKLVSTGCVHVPLSLIHI